MGHRPQLDGLRAIAAITVILCHAGLVQPFYGFDCGHAAVLFFFVLSGYLITGILVRARDEAARLGQSRTSVFVRFYGRRVLRIFPLYFAATGILFALGHPLVRRWITAYLLYAANFISNWDYAGWVQNAPGAGHFWSLAVEEQFYLLWPLVVLCVPRARLPFAVALLTLAGPVTRLLANTDDANSPLRHLMTSPTVYFDSLGVGALLAISPNSRLRDANVCVGAFGVLVLALATDGAMLFAPAAWSIICAWIVARAAEGTCRAWRALASRPMSYLGTISYGLYVWHWPIQWAVPRAYLFLRGRHAPADPLLVTFYVIPITVMVAAASWRWFEAPINDLKRLIPYNAAPPSRTTGAASPAVSAT